MSSSRFVLGLILTLTIVEHSAFAAKRSGLSTPRYSAAEVASVETSDDRQLRDIRNQEVNQIRITLGRRIPNNRRADLYFRLAEIYFEAYRSEYLIEGRVHARRIDQGRTGEAIDHSRSRPFLSLGIKACQDLIALRIPYDKMDRVLYFLAFNTKELGQKAKSLSYYTELIRRYPRSPFAAEAYRERAEAAFETRNYKGAIQAYDQAIGVAAPDVRPRLLHKQAWAYYRTRQTGRAVEAMKRAISGAIDSGEKLVSLKEEALRDMAIFMTESGRVQEAIDYFQSVAGDKSFYPKALERLAAEYERTVQSDKATQVYESLLRTHGSSEAAFRVLVKLVDLDLRRGRTASALGRLKGLKLPQGGEEETQIAAKNLKAMVRRTATENHEQWRKKTDRKALQVAEAFYSAYLTQFLVDESPKRETPEIQMYLAEVKRDLGKSQEASALYRLVVDSKDSRYAKEAGALWTTSLSEAIKKQSETQGKATRLNPSPLELEFVAAADRLSEALEGTSESRESSLRAAQVLAGYAQTQNDAISRIRKIISRWPTSAQAVTASRLWVQLIADRPESNDQLEALESVVKDLRARNDLLSADRASGGKLAALLSEQEVKLQVKAISKAEREGDLKKAALGYENFGNQSKDLAAIDRSYGAAVNLYVRSVDLESVNRVIGLWLKRAPKSVAASDALRSVATQLLIEGKFDASSELFERLGGEKNDPAAFITASRIAEALGKTDRSKSLRKRYLTQFQKHESRLRVLLDLARSHEASDEEAEAARLYRECMAAAKDESAECGVRLADLFVRGKNLAEAKKVYQQVSSRKARSPYWAYARYRLAELSESEARFEPLTLPEAQLKKGMAQRLEFLAPLTRAYTSAVEAGGPWGVAALYRLGAWALKFADEMDAIQPPTGANENVIANFKKSLKTVSDPLRAKALSTWSQGYQRAESQEILSAELPLLADRLADGGATFPRRAQGVRADFRLAGMPADSSFDPIRARLRANLKDASAWTDYGNTLWGKRLPLLAEIAYERALALNARYAPALNNLAVVRLSPAPEDALMAQAAVELLQASLKSDEFFAPAKFNLASIYTYYRLFRRARPLWDQVLVKAKEGDTRNDALDGLATALSGLGQFPDADAQFKAASGSSDRFARAFHEAARLSLTSKKSCSSRVDDISTSRLKGFEKDAYQRLKEYCQ